MPVRPKPKIHSTAEVHPLARIGRGTTIWHFAQVREKVIIGQECILGKNVYLDTGVKIGSRVKIQNNCSIYHGTTVESGVFLGPHVIATNDRNPRAINADGTLKKDSDWQVGKVIIRKGASIGANSVILPGVIVGKFALIGAGSVVTKDIPDFSLAYGNPARVVGIVCKCGKVIGIGTRCKTCGFKNQVRK